MVMMVIFIALAVSIAILKSNNLLLIVIGTLSNEIDSSCNSSTGLLHEIDSIYRKGDQVLCSASCECDTGNLILC